MMYRGQSLTFTKVYHGIFIKLSQLIKCIFIFDVSSSDEKCLVKFVILQKTSILLNNLIIKKKKSPNISISPIIPLLSLV